MRLVDALAVRIAGSAECRKMDQQLEALAKHIAHIEAQLAPNKVQGLQYQVDTVVAAAAAVVRPPLLPLLARDGVCSVPIECACVCIFRPTRLVAMPLTLCSGPILCKLLVSTLARSSPPSNAWEPRQPESCQDQCCPAAAMTALGFGSAHTSSHVTQHHCVVASRRT